MSIIKFTELAFQPHSIGEGKQALIFFPNGYGASVIQGPMFYSNGKDDYEVAPLKGTKESWGLFYIDGVAEDVVGYLTENEVERLLSKIAGYRKGLFQYLVDVVSFIRGLWEERK